MSSSACWSPFLSFFLYVALSYVRPLCLYPVHPLCLLLLLLCLSLLMPAFVFVAVFCVAFPCFVRAFVLPFFLSLIAGFRSCSRSFVRLFCHSVVLPLCRGPLRVPLKAARNSTSTRLNHDRAPLWNGLLVRLCFGICCFLNNLSAYHLRNSVCDGLRLMTCRATEE